MQCATMQAMDESYRLVFRGEVLDNQHPAVVKKRLIAALKLTDAQGERLFSGASVVLKQSADTKTAARFQGLFREAGARLRVLPVAEADVAVAQDPAAQPREPNAGGELQLQGACYAVPERPTREIQAPNFDVAELGVNMAEPRPAQVYSMEVDFELAPVGATIPTLPRDIEITVDMDQLDFEVAAVGADMADPQPDSNVAAPDTSHLQLVDHG